MMASRGCSILGSGTSSQRMSLGLCQHRAFIVLLRSLGLTSAARGLDGERLGCSRGPLAKRGRRVNARTIRIVPAWYGQGEGRFCRIDFVVRDPLQREASILVRAALESPERGA